MGKVSAHEAQKAAAGGQGQTEAQPAHSQRRHQVGEAFAETARDGAIVASSELLSHGRGTGREQVVAARGCAGTLGSLSRSAAVSLGASGTKK